MSPMHKRRKYRSRGQRERAYQHYKRTGNCPGGWLPISWMLREWREGVSENSIFLYKFDGGMVWGEA